MVEGHVREVKCRRNLVSDPVVAMEIAAKEKVALVKAKAKVNVAKVVKGAKAVAAVAVAVKKAVRNVKERNARVKDKHIKLY